MNLVESERRTPSASEIADRLRRRGSAITRQSMSSEQLQPIAAVACHYFSDQIKSGLPRSRYGGVPLAKVIAAGYSDVTRIFELIAASTLRRALEAFYGEPVAVPLHHALMRYYYPAENKYGHITPFHQDITGIEHRAAVTSWLPLTPCGLNAPGLELVDTKLDSPMTLDPDGPDKDFGIHPDRVMPHYIDRLVHPAFEPGDAALFLNTTLHRTYVTPEMTEARYSFECRYIPKSKLLPKEESPHFYLLA